MAIPILNHMDFQQKGEIRNVLLHKAGTGDISGNEAGQIIYDSGSIKFNNGSNWVTLGTGSGSGTVTSVTAGDGMTQSGTSTVNPTLDVVGGDGITANANDVAITAGQTTITSVYNTALKVGRAYVDASDHEMIDFATDGMIKLSVNGGEVRWNGTALIPGTDDARDLGSSTKQWRNLYIDGTAEVDVLAINGTSVTSTAAELNILDGVTSTAAELNILDGVTSTAAELNILDGVTSTAAELNILDGVTSTAAELNILDGVTSNATEINLLDGKTSLLELGTSSTTALAGDTAVDNISAANFKTKLGAGFASNAASIGDASDTITIPGNLVVSGTQTIQNETIQVVENNTIQFEGTTADDYEVKLTAADATSSDKTITLPNLSGHVALFAAAATETITSTPAELNILDGVTSTAAELNILDGVTSTAAELNILDGVTSTASELNILDGVTATASELNIMDGVTATTTELNYVDGVTSAIQTQLDAKEASANKLTKKLSGDASTTTFNITHSFSTPIVGVTVLDYGNNGSGATYDQVMVEIKRNSDDAVSLIFASAPSATEDYLVLIEKFPAIS